MNDATIEQLINEDEKRKRETLVDKEDKSNHIS